jgi:hypothetical protein
LSACLLHTVALKFRAKGDEGGGEGDQGKEKRRQKNNNNNTQNNNCVNTTQWEREREGDKAD